jgi:DNA-binding Xre family transcriptional regulator
MKLNRKKIFVIMMEKKMTYEVLSKKTGFGKCTLHHNLKKGKSPKLEFVVKLSEALEIDLKDVIDWKDE